MEVDALGAKGKGKGKKGRGGGKADDKSKKENPAKGKKCHNCGRTGHFKRDCWAEGGGARGKKGGGKNKSAAEVVDETAVTEITEASVYVMPLGVVSALVPAAAFEAEAPLTGMSIDAYVPLAGPCFDEGCVAAILSDTAVLVDSGAEVHVAPSWFASRGVVVKGARQLNLKIASGQALEHLGQRLVSFRCGDLSVKCAFEVAAVRRPILSVARLCDAGWSVDFSSSGAVLRHSSGVQVPLLRRGGVFLLMVSSPPPRAEDTSPSQLVFPLGPAAAEEDEQRPAAENQEEEPRVQPHIPLNLSSPQTARRS